MLKNMRSKNTISLFTALVIFLLGFFLFADLGIRYIFGYSAMGIIFVAYLVEAGILQIKRKPIIRARDVLQLITPLKACYLFMVAVMTFYALLSVYRWTHLTMSLTISMLVLSCFVLFSVPKLKEIRTAFFAFQIMAIWFSCYIILVRIIPDFYWKLVYPFLSPAARLEAEILMPLGYGVPVGASPIYADYIICVALLINASRMLFRGGIQNRNQLIFAVATSVLYLAAIFVVNRRTELLCVIAAIAVLFIVSLNRRRKHEFQSKLFLLCCVAAVGLILLLILAITGKLGRYASLFLALFSGGKAGDVSSGRIELWKEAWDYFLDNPLFGIGWHRFITITPNAHEVHNTYLQWLCETGIVGFLLMAVPRFVIFGVNLAQVRRLTRAKNANPFHKEISYVALGVQTFLLLADVIDPAYYHQHYFAFYGVAFLMLEKSLMLEQPQYGKHDLRKLVPAIWHYLALK